MRSVLCLTLLSLHFGCGTPSTASDAAPDARPDGGQDATIAPVCADPVPVAAREEPARCSPGEIAVWRVEEVSPESVLALADGFYSVGYGADYRGETQEGEVRRVDVRGADDLIASVSADIAAVRTVVDLGGAPYLAAASPTHLTLYHAVDTWLGPWLEPLWRVPIANVREVFGREDGTVAVVTYGYEDPPAWHAFDACGERVVERTAIVTEGASPHFVRVTVDARAPLVHSRADSQLRGAVLGDPLTRISPEGCTVRAHGATVVDGEPVWAWVCAGESLIALRWGHDVLPLAFDAPVEHVSVAAGPDGTLLVVASHAHTLELVAVDELGAEVARGAFDWHSTGGDTHHAGETWLSGPVDRTLRVDAHAVVHGEIPIHRRLLVDVCPAP